MRSTAICTGAIGLGWSGMALAASSASSSSSGGGGTVTTTASDGRDCEVVHKPASVRGDGTLSSSVTAGPDGVSGATTNGNGVRVQD